VTNIEQENLTQLNGAGLAFVFRWNVCVQFALHSISRYRSVKLLFYWLPKTFFCCWIFVFLILWLLAYLMKVITETHGVHTI